MTQPPDGREAIVRWLRSGANAIEDCGAEWMSIETLRMLMENSVYLEQIATAIERGEHLDHLSEQGEG